MGEVNQSPFASSAKGYVRQFDREIIKNFKLEHFPEVPLAYLGLPGPQVLDIQAWREFIGRWTGVQSTDNAAGAIAAEELELTVMREKLERDFQLVKGNIDELISTDTGQNKLNWPYQIVNLDYVGGIVQAKDDRTSRRLEAIKSLIIKQARQKFLLFITINLKDKDKGELEHYVQNVEDGFVEAGLVNVKERFDAHRALGNAGLLKIYVPTFLGSNAPQHTLLFNAPILYNGSKQMIHFAIQCIPFTSFAGGRLFSVIDQTVIINQPLLTSDKDKDLYRDGLGPKIMFASDEGVNVK